MLSVKKLMNWCYLCFVTESTQTLEQPISKLTILHHLVCSKTNQTEIEVHHSKSRTKMVGETYTTVFPMML